MEGTVRDRHVANYWTAAVVELVELAAAAEAEAAGQNGQSRFPQQNKMNDLEAVAVLESFVSRHLYPDLVPTPRM